jgi:DNA-binding transcriptional regulator YiaG
VAARWIQKKLRAKLELSTSEMGRLIGCSGQFVYKWEDGKARLRAKDLPVIAAVRKMRKRDAAAKLAELG